MEEDDAPTGHQRETALAFVFRGQQALHHQLFGAMRGRGEKAAADDAGQKGVGFCKEAGFRGQAEVEDLEFVGGAGHLDDVVPAAGNLPQDHEEAEDSPGHVEEHLDDVGPDDGGHAAFEGVEKRQADDQQNGDNVVRTEDNGDHYGDGKDSNPFRHGAQNQKAACAEFANTLAEAALHQFVGGEHFATEVVRKK